MDILGWVFSVLALALAISVQGQLLSIHRKQHAKDKKINSEVLKKELSDNIGKEVKFTFYEGDGVFKFNGVIYDESEVSCKIIDFDNTYVITDASMKKKNTTITKRYLLPLNNIRSIETEIN